MEGSSVVKESPSRRDFDPHHFGDDACPCGGLVHLALVVVGSVKLQGRRSQAPAVRTHDIFKGIIYLTDDE